MAIDVTEVPRLRVPRGEDGDPPACPGQHAARSGSAPTCCGPLPAASWATSSGTGWATSSPAATPTSRAAGRTTSPSCSGCPSAWSGGWAVSARSTTPGQAARPGAASTVPEQSWVRYFRMTDDHKVVGLQYLVGVLLFLFTGGLLAMAHPDRAPQPDQPRLRARDLHQHRRGARHHHDDDGVLGRRRAAGQLAGAAHDRQPPHGLSPGGGLLVLDLHGRLPVILTALPFSAASRPGGRATPRCRRRPQAGWTPIWSASPSSASG
jgi:hypothetical protein